MLVTNVYLSEGTFRHHNCRRGGIDTREIQEKKKAGVNISEVI